MVERISAKDYILSIIHTTCSNVGKVIKLRNYMTKKEQLDEVIRDGFAIEYIKTQAKKLN